VSPFYSDALKHHLTDKESKTEIIQKKVEPVTFLNVNT
jgi:hypothetical protein